MTPEERKEYMKSYKAEYREEFNTRQRRRRSEHKEELNARQRKIRSEHREEFNARMKRKRAEELNSNGVTKNNIRVMSGRILDKCHTKLPGYEIHHCFGYEDPEKFIYIHKSLHLKIHQFLRDNHISADSDHWSNIRDLVNSCEEYTYIRA